jgi:hypothetical protein
MQNDLMASNYNHASGKEMQKNAALYFWQQEYGIFEVPNVQR